MIESIMDNAYQMYERLDLHHRNVYDSTGRNDGETDHDVNSSIRGTDPHSTQNVATEGETTMTTIASQLEFILHQIYFGCRNSQLAVRDRRLAYIALQRIVQNLQQYNNQFHPQNDDRNDDDDDGKTKNPDGGSTTASDISAAAAAAKETSSTIEQVSMDQSDATNIDTTPFDVPVAAVPVVEPTTIEDEIDGNHGYSQAVDDVIEGSNDHSQAVDDVIEGINDYCQAVEDVKKGTNDLGQATADMEEETVDCGQPADGMEYESSDDNRSNVLQSSPDKETPANDVSWINPFEQHEQPPLLTALNSTNSSIEKCRSSDELLQELFAGSTFVPEADRDVSTSIASSDRGIATVVTTETLAQDTHVIAHTAPLINNGKVVDGIPISVPIRQRSNIVQHLPPSHMNTDVARNDSTSPMKSGKDLEIGGEKENTNEDDDGFNTNLDDMDLGSDNDKDEDFLPNQAATVSAIPSVHTSRNKSNDDANKNLNDDEYLPNRTASTSTIPEDHMDWNCSKGMYPCLSMKMAKAWGIVSSSSREFLEPFATADSPTGRSVRCHLCSVTLGYRRQHVKRHCNSSGHIRRLHSHLKSLLEELTKKRRRVNYGEDTSQKSPKRVLTSSNDHIYGPAGSNQYCDQSKANDHIYGPAGSNQHYDQSIDNAKSVFLDITKQSRNSLEHDQELALEALASPPTQIGIGKRRDCAQTIEMDQSSGRAHRAEIADFPFADTNENNDDIEIMGQDDASPPIVTPHVDKLSQKTVHQEGTRRIVVTAKADKTPTKACTVDDRESTSVDFLELNCSVDISLVKCRLEEWDPFWSNYDVRISTTSPVTLTLPTTNLIKTAASFVLDTDTYSAQIDAWGKKQPVQSTNSLVLRMLPLEYDRKNMIRSDNHLWPRGTFIQVSERPISIEQRKQLKHKLKEWRYMSKELNLASLIPNPKLPTPIDIFCYDDQVYIVCVSRSRYRSVDEVLHSLLDISSPKKIFEISFAAGLQRAVSSAASLISIDIDGDDNDATNELGKFIVSLKCPLSRAIMEIPVRGKDCVHHQVRST